MKKFQNFLLLMLLALSMNSYAQPFVQFTAQSATVDCETNDVIIDIDIENFTDVISWQYTVSWDPTVLTLTSGNIQNLMVLPSILPGTAGLTSGNLTLSWFSTGGPNGTTVGDGSIMRLTFDVIGNASQTSPVAFTSNVTNVNIAQYGIQLNSSQYVLTDGLLTITDSTNPMITCPSDITIDTGGGSTTQITGAAATVTDNCEIDFISYDLSAPTGGVGTGDVSNNIDFAVGTTTVTYTASDFGGNTASCNFDVEVTNNNAPSLLTISMDNLTLDCETNMASINVVADNFTDIRAAQFTVKWTPGLLDYIDTSNLVFPTGIVFGTSNLSTGELFFSWTDATGTGQSLMNGSTLFSINFNINSTAGITLPITFIENTGLPTQFTSVSSFPFPLDPTEYELNPGSIRLDDLENPTISCINDITVISTNGTDAIVDGIAPASVLDNCGIMDTTYSLSGLGTGTGDASGMTFPLGTTTVEYTVTDYGGNQATCSFDVTVVDPGPITVKIDSTDVSCDMDTVIVGFSVENFVDVRGIQFSFQWDPSQLEYSSIVADNLTPDGNFGLNQAPNGLITFSWFGDATTLQNGDNIIELKFAILNNTVGNSVDFIFLSAPTPYVVITAASFPNSVPTADINSIMGNVTIVDNSAPIITCPADVTVQSNGQASVAVNNIGATATDNCGTPDITYEIMTSTPINGMGDASGNLFPIGTTTVTYTATDEGGNTDVCSFTVTVMDTDPITVKIDSVEVSCDMSTVIVGFSVENFVDVRSVQFTFQWDVTQLSYASIIADNLTPDGTFGLSDIANGVITFSWFGNATTIQNGEDIIQLEFNILNNMVGNSVDFNFISSPTPFGITTTSSFPTAVPPSGTSPIMGNVTIVDTTAPMLTCPADVTIQSNGMSSIVVNDIEATATDNCGTPNITYEIMTSTPITGMGDASGNSFPVGTTTVTYIATDEGGNTDVCNFTVTVQDDPLMIECPLNFTQNTDIGVCSADLASFPISITSDPTNVTSITYAITGVTPNTTGTGDVPLTTYSVGITTITYTVMDNTGATETCSFTVTINDTEAPVFSNVPADVTIECDEMEPTDVPTATDNCDGILPVIETPITTNGPLPGSTIKKRIWSAVDGSNNIALDSQIITILDTSPPIINCLPDTIIEATSTGGVCESFVTWTIPTATDNCDTDVMTTSNPASGSFFGVGTHIVTIYGVDDAGNLDSCKFNVIITDSEAPNITCPNDTIISAGSACFASVAYNLPTVTDNCDNSIVPVSDFPNPHNFSIGNHTVTYTATDASGNVNTCTFNITVLDTELPNISCSPDITVSANGSSTPNTFLDTIIQVGCDSAILEFALPLGADNCMASPTVTQTAGLPSGSTFGVGTHVMEFTVVDESNNVNTCSFEITVNPFVALSITALQDTLCINETTQFFVGQNAIPGATYTWTGPNGTIASIYNPIIGNVTLADSGTYTVMVDDQVGGCSGMATIELVVEDGPEITITSNPVNCISGPTDVPLSADNVGSIGVVSWTWKNPAGMIIGNTQNIVIEDATEDSSGVYTLEVLGTNGCTSIFPTTVTITDTPEDPLLTSECGGFLCAFETCTLSVLSLPPGDIDSIIWTATGGAPGLPFDPTTNQIIIQPTQEGIYTYTLTVYSDGCTSSSTIPLQVSQAANVDPDFFEVPFQGALSNFDVTENDTLFGSLPGTYVINVTSDVVNGTLVNNQDGTFSYTPNEGYFGTDQFIYELCIECNGMTECRWAIVTLDVTSDECLIPTVLTPNGDKLNDAWQITCIGDFPENEVMILNRWGDVIFEATGYNNDWEGTYNNQDVPDGTYFYIFKKNAADSDPQKGTITISR